MKKIVVLLIIAILITWTYTVYPGYLTLTLNNYVIQTSWLVVLFGASFLFGCYYVARSFLYMPYDIIKNTKRRQYNNQIQIMEDRLCINALCSNCLPLFMPHKMPKTKLEQSILWFDLPKNKQYEFLKNKRNNQKFSLAHYSTYIDCLLQENQIEKALCYIKKATTRYPKSYIINILKAQALCKKNEFLLAYKILDKLHQDILPKEVVITLCLLWINSLDSAEAIKNCYHGLRKNFQKNEKIFTSYIELLVKYKEIDYAKKILFKKIKKENQFLELWLAQFKTLSDIKEYAIECKDSVVLMKIGLIALKEDEKLSDTIINNLKRCDISGKNNLLMWHHLQYFQAAIKADVKTQNACQQQLTNLLLG